MNNKGFTLIEIIVTIAILSIVIVPLSSMFIQAAKINSMAAEEYDATLIAQKHFEEVKSIKDNIDAGLKGYTFNSDDDSYNKHIANYDGKFDVSVDLTAVAGTENINSDNTNLSLRADSNIYISFDESNTEMTITYSKDVLTDSNIGNTKKFNIININTLMYELVFDGSRIDVQGTAVQTPSYIDTSDFTDYKIAIMLNGDVNMEVYNKMDSVPVKFTAIVPNGSAYDFNLTGKEGLIEEDVNIIQGNIEKLSNSILYNVLIIVSRNGKEVTRFTGMKAFSK